MLKAIKWQMYNDKLHGPSSWESEILYGIIWEKIKAKKYDPLNLLMFVCVCVCRYICVDVCAHILHLL